MEITYNCTTPIPMRMSKVRRSWQPADYATDKLYKPHTDRLFKPLTINLRLPNGFHIKAHLHTALNANIYKPLIPNHLFISKSPQGEISNV
ncbi:hypothetical protein SG34_010470 [Thalassomonas viridans]|uniref:Uncharacterized protein n=1 Tax=Thalassomonas viridans TaxID=137584 RepID=A0AAE9Z5Y2_9GAMM|nr:hypothetical protein [Thalassomonas viridans]WDE07270.1 hypothetical protein SG34_010470 [Thalassomonas viridans]